MSDERHVRSVSGRVHLIAEGRLLTTSCGINLAALEPTEEPVTCRHCLRQIGQTPAVVEAPEPTAAEGEPEVVSHADLQEVQLRAERRESARKACDLRRLLERSDALLEAVERINLAAAIPTGRGFVVPNPAPEIHPALSVRIGRLRHKLGLARRLPQRSDQALERIYEAQQAIFRRLNPRWTALNAVDLEEEVAVG